MNTVSDTKSNTGIRLKTLLLIFLIQQKKAYTEATLFVSQYINFIQHQTGFSYH